MMATRRRLDAATGVALATVAGIAAMAYLWFLGTVRAYLGGRDVTHLAAAASAGGVFAITVLLLGMMMFGGGVPHSCGSPP